MGVPGTFIRSIEEGDTKGAGLTESTRVEAKKNSTIGAAEIKHYLRAYDPKMPDAEVRNVRAGSRLRAL